MTHTMRQIRLATLALSLALPATLAAGPALADDDCNSPMAQWQSRESAMAWATGLGIKVERMRVDDGCYKMRGRDSENNRVELKVDPATFAVMEMDVRFRPGANVSRYLPGAGAAGTEVAPKKPTDNPLITPGTAPKATSN